MSDLLNSASLVMIPSGYKEDTVFSQIPTDGSGDLSFTRASNGTRINSAGLVEVCPWNLLEQSETFDSGTWSKTGVTVTANTTTAPNGTTTADTLVFGASSNEIVQSVGNLVVDQTYTLTIYLRVASGTATMYWGNIDYTTPSITVTTEWQRFTVTQQAAATTRYPKLVSSSALTIFAWGAQLNIGSTAKPYFPTTDRLNVPRLTYQNGGGGCPSLLLEKQSTNLVTYSEQFDNADWLTAGGITVTANATTSPDGTQNADFFSHGSFGTYLYQYLGTLSGTITTSIFVKKGSQSSIAFGFVSGGFGGGMSVKFNFDTQTFSTPTNYANFTSISATYESYGNGWYRLNLTGTTATSTIYYYVLGSLLDSFAVNAYLWGAQVEASSYPTSYIPTTSSSATRVADVCSKTGISSLIGQTEGVLFVDFQFQQYDGQPKWVAFLGAGASYIGVYTNSSSKFVCEISNSGANQFINDSYTFAINQRYKIALAYKANDFVLYINGTQVATDSSGTVPSTSQLSLQYNTTPDNLTSRTYNQVVVFPTRLTNAELQALTTL